MNNPDMNRAAKSIHDDGELFKRIGYRLYLAWLKGDEKDHKLYEGFNHTDMRRAKELRGDS
jgi:hypothetical protein